ncbi:unnamed protein product [[Candida] boidinii]|nr:unnamed protein product [[Candida] boidinii]
MVTTSVETTVTSPSAGVVSFGEAVSGHSGGFSTSFWTVSGGNSNTSTVSTRSDGGGNGFWSNFSRSSGFWTVSGGDGNTSTVSTRGDGGSNGFWSSGSWRFSTFTVRTRS